MALPPVVPIEVSAIDESAVNCNTLDDGLVDSMVCCGCFACCSSRLELRASASKFSTEQYSCLDS